MNETSVAIDTLHWGKTQAQRLKVLEVFKFGITNALVASDAAARGIFVVEISLVVHVDAPENYKDNLYRAGSTAKAGAVRTVATLATHNQRKGMHELATIARVRINESSFSPTDANLAKVTSKAEPFGISAMTTQVGKSKHSRRTGSYRRSRSRGGGKSPDNPHMSA